MSFNGSGTFVINSAGQPVVTGTTIASTAFNSLTADLATGLSTTLTKDGQSTPTANIPMGTFKITGLGNGTASTDAINLGQAQGAFVGIGYTTTATAAGTTTLTVASNINQFFTGVTTQTVVLPVVTTLPALGFQFRIVNLSSGTVTVNSSGGNLVASVTANQQVTLTCILLTGTDALSWDVKFSGATSVTGTGSTVRATSPALVTPDLGIPSAATLTNATGLPLSGLIKTVAGTWTGVQTFSNGIIFADETLSTYDEGTWTPAITLGGGSLTYTQQTGKYRKIGTLVVCTGQLIVNVATTPSGAATVTGLPFTAGNASGNRSIGGVSPVAFAVTLTTTMIADVVQNTTTMQLKKYAATGGANSEVGPDFANSCILSFGFSYFTS